MAQTIFYSWQSDLPNKTNRGLIKRALDEAANLLKADVYEAPREDIKIDQDTAGVPGTPDIAATILDKIEKCDAFVPDVSIIGSAGARPTPSPNVMIEYGYALKAVGDSCIVTVFNEAFGSWEHELPFDMRHKRKPILFKAPEGESEAAGNARKDARIKLSKDLAHALRLIVSNSIPEPSVEFEEAEAFDEGSIFVPPGAPIGLTDGFHRTRELPVYLDEGPRVFLRMIPKRGSQQISMVRAEEIVRSPIPLLGQHSSADRARNEFGAFLFGCGSGEQGDKVTTWTVTQLFQTGELWSIDTNMLGSERDGDHWIPTTHFEDHATMVLDGFLRLAKEKLNLEPPVLIKIGMNNVRRFKLSGPARLIGRIDKNNIAGEFKVSDFSQKASDLLQEFFIAYYDAAGVDRS